MLDILCRVVLGYSISTKVYHLTLKTSPSFKLSNGRYLRLLVPPVVRADQEVSAAIAFSSHLQAQPLDQSRRLDHPYLPMADDSVQILSRCRSCSRQGKLGTYLVNQYILRWKKSHLRFHFRLKILASMIASIIASNPMEMKAGLFCGESGWGRHYVPGFSCQLAEILNVFAGESLVTGAPIMRLKNLKKGVKVHISSFCHLLHAVCSHEAWSPSCV
ncbi:hypothetical protein I3843_01G006300 [Carya illinoinensis]|nr:hypothetical protein I3843_01G006300 [Carya illinoinensis]